MTALADPAGFVDDDIARASLPIDAEQAVEAWLDVDPTERCMRVVRCHREWWLEAYVLGERVASGFGRTLPLATANLGRELWTKTRGAL